MEILDKINKALDCEEYKKCNECPYVKFGECKILLIRDVRELLQYQEKKIDRLLEKSASLRENIERIEEERFVESLISLWIQPDAPEWIIDYVRTELRKQRGLLEENDSSVMEKS